MKKQLLIIIGFLFLGEFYAQCPPGDLSLLSQTQINDFVINYPNCTEIAGNLTIHSPSATSLLPFTFKQFDIRSGIT